MRDDIELLRHWSEHQAEEAFAELVRRHVNLVYAVALRKVSGDAHLAEDVVQRVFADLARKAPALTKHPVLTAWLFTSTHYTATRFMRAERRRRDREQKAYAMNELLHDDSAAIDWEKLRPLLDDLVLELNERDREAVLLRFFEGRGFAEIGVRLRLTEEGARARVDRAVDKLQALLARRGITSTSGALGIALASQASAAAPAALAASVAASAITVLPLTSALAFMSSVKLTTGALLAAAALITSITGNVYLLARASPAAAAPAAQPAPPFDRAALASAPTSNLALVQQVDLTLLRDQLRAAHVSERSIRAALEGILRRRYREQLSQNRASRMQRGWWRDYERTWGTAGSLQGLIDDQRLLREMVTLPLEALLGPDPAQMAELNARYAFLPPELREQIWQLDRDRVTGWSPTGIAETDARLRAEFEAQNTASEAKRQQLVAAMTSEQRANYEMRFSPFSVRLARQLDAIEVTEQEFCAIFPIADAHAKALASPGGRTNLAERNRETAEKLISALGYDRALDYIWGGAVEYPPVARLAREQHLPANTAAQALQLAAETGEKATAIHVDSQLGVPEKRIALAELQHEVRTQFDRLIPPATQSQLPPRATTWLTVLADGRYKPIGTVLPGQVGTIVLTSEVRVSDPPPRGDASTPFVPRRPPGG